MLSKRKWLFLAEYKQVVKAAQKTSLPLRNSAIVRISTAHGLRVSELINLTWNDVDLHNNTIFISRGKNSISGTHPLEGWEIGILKRLKNKYHSHYLVPSRRGEKLQRTAINYIVSLFRRELSLNVNLTPHTFRHTCGYFLAENGWDVFRIKSFLGHREIESTLEYFQGYEGSDRGGRVNW